MKNYELYVENDNLIYIQVDNTGKRIKTASTNDAYRNLKKIITADNMSHFKVINKGVDKVFSDSKCNIIIKNLDETLTKIEKLRKKERKFKKAAIGLAGVVTVGVIASGIISTMNKEHEEKIQVRPVIESIQEENDTTIEQQIDEYVDSLASVTTLPPSDDTNYVDIEPYYDAKLDQNVSNYQEIIEEVSNRWGIDPKLLTDVVKQESRGGEVKNKGQVQYGSWEDMKLVCYNFEKNKYQTIVFTNDPSKYKRGADEPEYIFISEEEFKNQYTSLSSSALILANIYNGVANKNLTRTLIIYNQGRTASDKVYQEQSRVENIPFETLINDENNVDYYKYSYVLDKTDENGKIKHHGDPYYIQNVLKQGTQDFNLEDGKCYTMQTYDKYGNTSSKETKYRSSLEKEVARIN